MAAFPAPLPRLDVWLFRQTHDFVVGYIPAAAAAAKMDILRLRRNYRG